MGAFGQNAYDKSKVRNKLQSQIKSRTPIVKKDVPSLWSRFPRKFEY